MWRTGGGREIRAVSSGPEISRAPSEGSGCCSAPSMPRSKPRLCVLEMARAQPVTQQSLSHMFQSCGEKKQIVEQINEDTQRWSLWPQQCSIHPVARQHLARCQLWVCKHQPRISPNPSALYVRTDERKWHEVNDDALCVQVWGYTWIFKLFFFRFCTTQTPLCFTHFIIQQKNPLLF